jgi:hypothetical protein
VVKQQESEKARHTELHLHSQLLRRLVRRIACTQEFQASLNIVRSCL